MPPRLADDKGEREKDKRKKALTLTHSFAETAFFLCGGFAGEERKCESEAGRPRMKGGGLGSADESVVGVHK